mmetsp:Transcript_5663/g.11112  ORF Transcript_5663/g.11112 Transcript_5663/m.11112 type:complete len:96 (+) Transcript_5663:315-602(+)
MVHTLVACVDHRTHRTPPWDSAMPCLKQLANVAHRGSMSSNLPMEHPSVAGANLRGLRSAHSPGRHWGHSEEDGRWQPERATLPGVVDFCSTAEC